MGTLQQLVKPAKVEEGKIAPTVVAIVGFFKESGEADDDDEPQRGTAWDVFHSFVWRSQHKGFGLKFSPRFVAATQQAPPSGAAAAPSVVLYVDGVVHASMGLKGSGRDSKKA